MTRKAGEGRAVTKPVEMKFQPGLGWDDDEDDLVEVINNQRGRGQQIGWGVFRGGKLYIVGTSKKHAKLNLNTPGILNLPPR